jgi:hypothetical protein
MPLITVSADDDRHSQHGEFLDFVDSPLSAAMDWGDVFPDEGIDVDWSEMTEDDFSQLD